MSVYYTTLQTSLPSDHLLMQNSTEAGTTGNADSALQSVDIDKAIRIVLSTVPDLAAQSELDTAYETCEALRIYVHSAEQQYIRFTQIASTLERQMVVAKRTLVEAYQRVGILLEVVKRGSAAGEIDDVDEEE